MTNNKKGRTGWHQATLKTSNHTHDFTDPAARIKAATATLAMWGLIPVTLADWLIQQGGLRHV